MLISHRIALDPNNGQATYFARAAGTARFAWNWALAEWQRQSTARKADPSLPAPSEAALRRLLNAIKAEQFPWMMEVTKNAPQQAIKNVGAAFKRFFARQGKCPRFKKKGVARDSFRADGGTDKAHPNAVAVDGKRIKLPVVGWVRMREALRFQGKVMSAVVSRTADRWFVSLTVEIQHQVPIRENQAAVGVDLGVLRLATLSDGGEVTGPKALKANLKRLRRLSRSLSRKVKGSSNRRRAAGKIARLHARISNIRKDSLHKLTTDISSRFAVVGIEDLNVRGMMANDRLARSIADMGFHEFRRQLDYKMAMSGGSMVVADRWFPSSKTCSDCGATMDALPLSIREWDCPACGAHHDRDLNAARNLERMAVSSTVSACGEEGPGPGRKIGAKPASVKQEPSTEATYG
jgi:putative transposase